MLTTVSERLNDTPFKFCIFCKKFLKKFGELSENFEKNLRIFGNNLEIRVIKQFKEILKGNYMMCPMFPTLETLDALYGTSFTWQWYKLAFTSSTIKLHHIIALLVY